jgi:hypothetical protein
VTKEDVKVKNSDVVTRNNKWIWILSALVLVAVILWFIEFVPWRRKPQPPPSLYATTRTNIEDVLAEAVRLAVSNPSDRTIFPGYVVKPSRGIPGKVYEQLQEKGLPINRSPKFDDRVVVVSILGYWQVTEDMWVVILSKIGGVDSHDRIAIVLRYLDFEDRFVSSDQHVTSQEPMLPSPQIHIFSGP